MISETMKWLIDQALEYPQIRENLASASGDEEIQDILQEHGIRLSPQQILHLKEYIENKLKEV